MGKKLGIRTKSYTSLLILIYLKNGPTFSLIILRDKTQRLLNFCSPAAVPTEWKVQLVMVGKTVHIGLGISSLVTWS